jgi:hypothetical protein
LDFFFFLQIDRFFIFASLLAGSTFSSIESWFLLKIGVLLGVIGVGCCRFCCLYDGCGCLALVAWQLTMRRSHQQNESICVDSHTIIVVVASFYYHNTMRFVDFTCIFERYELFSDGLPTVIVYFGKSASAPLSKFSIAITSTRAVIPFQQLCYILFK